jgi:hypothetical protein
MRELSHRYLKFNLYDQVVYMEYDRCKNCGHIIAERNKSIWHVGEYPGYSDICQEWGCLCRRPESSKIENPKTADIVSIA